MNASIAEQRLHNQHITRPTHRQPAKVVTWLGAVQAQEYPFARWALALRMAGDVTDASVARAVDEGRILRTHVMRPTWHFVAAADIRWMLELTAPRVHKVMAGYCLRQGLDAAVRTRATAVVERAIGDGGHLTRADLAAHLERSGLEARGVRLALLMMHAELEGVICSGAPRGKQMTYALIAERAPKAKLLQRDEALAELVTRYFQSHGPATIRDFVWWSGLTTPDARRGLEIARARPDVVDGLTYWTVGAPATPTPLPRGRIDLLPIYDEYVVSYRDRAAVPHAPGTLPVTARGSVTFQHALVIGGQVTGTWKLEKSSGTTTVNVIPLRRLAGAERRGIAEAVECLGRFLDSPVSLSLW